MAVKLLTASLSSQQHHQHSRPALPRERKVNAISSVVVSKERLLVDPAFFTIVACNHFHHSPILCLGVVRKTQVSPNSYICLSSKLSQGPSTSFLSNAVFSMLPLASEGF